MVEPAFDPLGAVAAAAEPVTFEFAVGRVTSEDERIHEGKNNLQQDRAPFHLLRVGNAGGELKWVKKSGGFLSLVQNGYKTVTKTTRLLGPDW